MINAATKCMPLPDPDLIKSCCPHLLFLIPLQYLYMQASLPQRRGRGDMLVLRDAGRWLAG